MWRISDMTDRIILRTPVPVQLYPQNFYFDLEYMSGFTGNNYINFNFKSGQEGKTAVGWSSWIHIISRKDRKAYHC